MLRKLFFALALLVGAFSYGYAQVGSGSLQGTIADAETGETLPFANVVLENKGNQIAGGTADFDGKYSLRPIPPGTYDLLISYVGYTTQRITNVVINSDQVKKQDIKLQPGIAIGQVEVFEYKEPLVEIDKGTTGGKVSAEDIKSMAIRSAADVAKTIGGVYSKDDGGTGLNIRGARTNSSITFIDGVKVIGSANLPKEAIGEVSVITGGIPAQYGDATGGLTIITTKEAIKTTFGSLEYLTSGFKTGENTVTGLDSYGFNLLGFSVGGPMFPKKNEEGKVVSAPVGYLLSGEFTSVVDPRGSAVDIYKVKDDVLADLKANPYSLLDAGPAGLSTVNNAEYLRSGDFETIGFRKNTALNRFNVSGKLDFNTSETSKITIGGSLDFDVSNVDARSGGAGGDAFSLYNWENNPQNRSTDYRVFARFQKSFKDATSEEESESASIIKNAFFSIQADYTKTKAVRQSEQHEDNLFNYGYVGKFDAEIENSYGFERAVLLEDANGNTDRVFGRFLTAFDSPVSYNFTPSDINPILSNYNRNVYSFYSAEELNTIDNLISRNGISNGRMPQSVYSMWSSVGDVQDLYRVQERDQFRVSGSASAQVKQHELQVGFEYEQRIERFYALAPHDLWNVGRNSVNSHILSIDSNLYTIDYSRPDGPFVTFERRFDGENQTAFSYNMREALGLDVNGKDFIDFDSYDPNLYNINWFGAEQLINPANGVGMNYYGFDHRGNKVNNVSLNDFFNAVDDNGFNTRLIAPYQPIYVSGYVQDKFKFDDLILRVGVRVDRFDANQPVLKDQFSLAPIRTVGSLKGDGSISGSEVPGNIGDDFVVYTDNLESPSTGTIRGYRDGDAFFNARGVEIEDPSSIYAAGQITPWLVDPSAVSGEINGNTNPLTENSFEDYEPQVTVMPRVSFSFPISDEATFFANYDILTQRPSSNNEIQLINYNYLQALPGNTRTNNPNLRPEKTINYELGFKQALNKSSALTISSFYREQRDMIQVRKLTGAFPVDYITYDNIDFGTVKGATLTYDLRRTKNIQFKASYTIQFAEGTGSSTTTSLNLVNSGQPNLRTIIPYNYDQRHALTATIDFRYGSGKDYNGPMIKSKPILENFGVNLVVLGGSGTPYTARDRANGQEIFSGGGPEGSVTGDVNGSRLPLVFRVNARIDKDFLITWKKGSDDSKAKQSYLNVFLQILNLTDRNNVSDVYGYTGSPEDDGFLASNLFTNLIETQLDEQAYRDQYNIKLSNPYNYELPRRFRLGMSISF